MNSIKARLPLLTETDGNVYQNQHKSLFKLGGAGGSHVAFKYDQWWTVHFTPIGKQGHTSINMP